jgi:hypothetical protein
MGLQFQPLSPFQQDLQDEQAEDNLNNKATLAADLPPQLLPVDNVSHVQVVSALRDMPEINTHYYYGHTGCWVQASRPKTSRSVSDGLTQLARLFD